MSPTASFKVCIFGDSGVGKTTLTYRFVTERFIQNTKSTLGVDIVAKDLIIDDYSVKLQIWDFGGEERFRTFLPVYARGSSGGIFMYDTTRKDTLNNVEDWLAFFREHSSINDEKVPILIVGGKKDLNHLKSVSIEDAIDLAMKYDLDDVMECSSKTGENVEQIFTTITRKLLKTFSF
ncbi:MAG: Rab family GTPase [Candidatus Hermodarchaeota archaeon]